jgi:hypothetical protein
MCKAVPGVGDLEGVEGVGDGEEAGSTAITGTGGLEAAATAELELALALALALELELELELALGVGPRLSFFSSRCFLRSSITCASEPLALMKL